MWLKDAPETSSAKAIPCRPQCRPNLGGMVGVVIDEGHAPPRPLLLEPTADSAKMCQSTRNFRGRYSLMMAKGNRGQRVENVVPPGKA